MQTPSIFCGTRCSLEKRAQLTIEIVEDMRKVCSSDFQIGWNLLIDCYGLVLEKLREVTADFFNNELIDYLNLVLWDSTQIIREEVFQTKTIFSIFTELPRKSVRLGVAGKIYSEHHSARLSISGKGKPDASSPQIYCDDNVTLPGRTKRTLYESFKMMADHCLIKFPIRRT